MPTARSEPVTVGVRRHGAVDTARAGGSPSVLRRVVGWALVGLAAQLVVVGVFLVREKGNPEWFVHFGRSASVLPLARQALGPDLLVPNPHGSDGQAYWALARDPLLLHPAQNAAYTDRPVYRAQRVLYPALAAPFRLLGERALLWGLIIVNLVAVLIGGIVTGLLSVELGGPAVLALAFIVNPAPVVSTVADMSDGVALCALVAAVLALVRGRRGWALVAGALAVLAKEPSLFGLLGVALLAPRPRRDAATPDGGAGLQWGTRIRLVVVPGLVAVAWAIYIRWRLHWPKPSIQEFSAPFVGYIDAWGRFWWRVGNWSDATVAFLLLPAAAVVVLLWWRRRSLLLAAAVPFALIVPFESAQVLNVAINSLRAFAPAVLFVLLDLGVWYRTRSTGSPAAANLGGGRFIPASTALRGILRR